LRRGAPIKRPLLRLVRGAHRRVGRAMPRQPARQQPVKIGPLPRSQPLPRHQADARERGNGHRDDINSRRRSNEGCGADVIDEAFAAFLLVIGFVVIVGPHRVSTSRLNFRLVHDPRPACCRRVVARLYSHSHRWTLSPSIDDRICGSALSAESSPSSRYARG
jgi:hypothetical protein